MRGSSAYTDEVLRRGSPLAKGSTIAARGEDVVPSTEGSGSNNGADTPRSESGVRTRSSTKGDRG